MDSIEVLPGLTIPEDELQFSYTRSGGPGGQNVNKLNTRVELLFDIEASSSLSEVQKQRIRRRLSKRINREGVLRIVSQKERSQLRNRREAVDRFARMLAQALEVRTRRVPTGPSRAARKRRMEEKKKRAQLKRARRRTAYEE